jgi:hypothetical protein
MTSPAIAFCTGRMDIHSLLARYHSSRRTRLPSGGASCHPAVSRAGCYTIRMQEISGDAGDANSTDTTEVASPIVTKPHNSDADTATPGDASVATMTAALAHNLKYTLTVGQVRQLFATRRRKIPSERSIQRYCIDRELASDKIRTTYGMEWLINEESVAEFIERQPAIESGDAGDANSTDTTEVASPIVTKPHNSDADTATMASPATPILEHSSLPIGERRTITEVLIENAKLLAQLDGRDELIAEIRSDKSFLKSELSKRDDAGIKQLAQQMLQTLETMAVGRRIEAPGRPPNVVEVDARPLN